MKRQRKRRFGRLVFFLPAILLLAVIAYAFLTSGIGGNGTLVVQAQSSYGSVTRYIAATATVNGVSGKTPFDLALTPSMYTVTFGQLEGYTTPQPRTTPVLGGKTTFAVGVYIPIPEITGVAAGGFNMTQARGLHGITPFVWINQATEAIQLKSSAFNTVVPPGQNFTYIFSATGHYQVVILGTALSQNLTIV